MLRRFLIILIEMGIAAILLVALCLFWASYYVDTNEFRESFVTAVEQISGRHIILDGELNIALYPNLSLEVLDLSMKDDPQFGQSSIARFNSLRVSVRLMPLLSQRLEIRSIVVEGMEINIVRSSEGRINWQTFLDQQFSLLSAGISGEQTFAVSLDGLEVFNATISYTDKLDNQTFGLSGIDIRTGAIVPGHSIPFTADSRFAWKNGGVTSEIVLKGMIEVDEDEKSYFLNDSTIYCKIGGAFLPLGASPGEMAARLVVDWDKKTVSLDDFSAQFLGLRAEGDLGSGDLSQGFEAQGHVTLHPFNPAEIIGRYFPEAPVKSVDGLKRGAFSSSIAFGGDSFSLKNMKISLDDLTVKGDLGISGYSNPSFSFDVQGGMVDLDRYLPLFRTDTPFIWDDFGLEFFQALRGKGTVRASGFKLLDEQISDIKLSVIAENEGIRAGATANREGEGPLSGTAIFRFGKNDESQVLTLGMDVDVASQSQKRGFALLNMKPLEVTGVGQLKAKLKVSQMDCPPLGRSIDLLRHLSGDISLDLGAGQGSYEMDAETRYPFKYSKAACLFKVTPRKVQSDGYYGFNTDLSIQGHGGKYLRSFSLFAQGPLVTAVDEAHVLSSGLIAKGNIAGPLYSDESSRLDVSGNIGFDSGKHLITINDAMVRTLETTVKGRVQLTDLNTSFKGKGRLEVPEANLRRIIYLLTKSALRTKDSEALKAASLEANISLSESGFRLSELEGKLDGMSFNGNIVGQGFQHPKLVFSFAAGEFDLDRYLPRTVKLSLEDQRAGRVYKAPPVPLPLGFLRWLSMTGKGWFEEFKIAKIRARSVSANLTADEGIIHISAIKGKVHSGLLTGDWSGKVGEESLSTHLMLHIEDMQAGPFMKDMADREYVRGETDIDFDLISSGGTDDAILENLDGKAWTRINNGSFKFNGYDAKTSSVERETSSMGMKTDTKKRRTVFQKAMGYFNVNKGIFTVDKFRVEAPPMLQSYGSGNFNLPENTINLSVRNDFVAVPSVTIEVVGKLSDPEVRVPKGKILNNTVRNILSLPEKSFNFLRDLFQ